MNRVSGGGAHLHAKQALLVDIVAGGKKGVYGFMTWQTAQVSIFGCPAAYSRCNDVQTNMDWPEPQITAMDPNSCSHCRCGRLKGIKQFRKRRSSPCERIGTPFYSADVAAAQHLRRRIHVNQCTKINIATT